MPRKRKIVIICLIFAEFLVNVPFLDRNIFLNFLMLEKKSSKISVFFFSFSASCSIERNIHLEVSCKKCVLKHFSKFT